MNIEKIKERAEAATPGPWTGWHKNTWENTDRFSMDFGSYEGQIVIENNQHSICSVHCDNNIEFIAHAREDIPELIAVVERKTQNEAKLINDMEEYKHKYHSALADKEAMIKHLRLLGWCNGCKHFAGLGGCRLGQMESCAGKNDLYEWRSYAKMGCENG